MVANSRGSFDAPLRPFLSPRAATLRVFFFSGRLDFSATPPIRGRRGGRWGGAAPQRSSLKFPHRIQSPRTPSFKWVAPALLRASLIAHHALERGIQADHAGFVRQRCPSRRRVSNPNPRAPAPTHTTNTTLHLPPPPASRADTSHPATGRAAQPQAPLPQKQKRFTWLHCLRLPAAVTCPGEGGVVVAVGDWQHVRTDAVKSDRAAFSFY